MPTLGDAGTLVLAAAVAMVTEGVGAAFAPLCASCPLALLGRGGEEEAIDAQHDDGVDDCAGAW